MALAEDIVQENAQLSVRLYPQSRIGGTSQQIAVSLAEASPALEQTSSEKEVVKGESEGSPGEDRGTDDYRGE